MDFLEKENLEEIERFEKASIEKVKKFLQNNDFYGCKEHVKVILEQYKKLKYAASFSSSYGVGDSFKMVVKENDKRGKRVLYQLRNNEVLDL